MHTQSFEEVTQAIVDLLKEHQDDLGLKDVWYGDQELIPRTPAVAVESGSKTRELTGAPDVTTNRFTVFVLTYMAKIQDVQTTRKMADQLAEAIELLLHDDTTIGGLVIFGMCTSVEPGYAIRGGTLMRAARITWEGFTKLRMGA